MNSFSWPNAKNRFSAGMEGIGYKGGTDLQRCSDKKQAETGQRVKSGVSEKISCWKILNRASCFEWFICCCFDGSMVSSNHCLHVVFFNAVFNGPWFCWRLICVWRWIILMYMFKLHPKSGTNHCPKSFQWRCLNNPSDHLLVYFLSSHWSFIYYYPILRQNKKKKCFVFLNIVPADRQ